MIFPYNLEWLYVRCESLIWFSLLSFLHSFSFCSVYVCGPLWVFYSPVFGRGSFYLVFRFLKSGVVWLARASLVAQMAKICLQCRRPRSDPRVGKIPWRREWQFTPVFLPGESHGQRGLVGFSPCGCRESSMIKGLHCLWLGKKSGRKQLQCFWRYPGNLSLNFYSFHISAEQIIQVGCRPDSQQMPDSHITSILFTCMRAQSCLTLVTHGL